MFWKFSEKFSEKSKIVRKQWKRIPEKHFFGKFSEMSR